MTPQQFVGLGIRLFSVWLVLSSIRYLSSVPQEMVQMGETAGRAYFVGGAYLLAAAFLWFFPMAIAHRLIPRTSFPERMTVPAFSAARVGCALIGLWLFARSITGLTWYFFSALVIPTQGSFLDNMLLEVRIAVAVQITEFILSALLITRSSYFARIVVPGNDNDR
ncbi:MAG: hypothetical protein FWH56_07495 [Betaproteobacteria bacterium]|nr:hypothetical protein [Betaproteobacteria bacterium]